MKPKFIAALYYEGRIILIEEFGDVYELSIHTRTWQLLCKSPWPEAKP